MNRAGIAVIICRSISDNSAVMNNCSGFRGPPTAPFLCSLSLPSSGPPHTVSCCPITTSSISFLFFYRFPVLSPFNHTLISTFSIMKCVHTEAEWYNCWEFQGCNSVCHVPLIDKYHHIDVAFLKNYSFWRPYFQMTSALPDAGPE
jgi:hypothetical protein